MIKRLLAGAAVAVAMLIPATTSQAAGTANVTMVHGIGPAPQPVDVYVDNALAAANFQYSNQATLSNVAEGTHNVKLCVHAANPPATITDCASYGTTSVNSNTGTDLTLTGGKSYTAVAAYAPSGATQGRPTVLAFEDTTTCANNARMDLYHAAAFAGDVNVLLDTQNLGTVAPGAAGLFSGSAKTNATVDIQKASDNTSLFTQTNVALPANVDTIKIFVGNPQQDANYDILTRTINVGACPTTTTSTTAPSTTSTTVRAATVTPRFTG